MKPALRWTLVLALVLASLAAVLVAAALRLAPGDAELASRVATAAQENLGVKVTVGRAHLQLWPQPEFVLSGVATVQPQPIRIERLVAQPRLSELLRGRLSFRRADIDGAVIPQLTLRALEMKAGGPGASHAMALSGLQFRRVTWITRRGKELEFEGNVAFDPGWQPRRAELVRSGVQPAPRLALSRQEDGRWRLQAQLGGGTSDGQVVITRDKELRLELSGELSSRDVEVASLLDAFKARSPVRGRASGQTRLSASGKNIAELASSLHTRTRFSMAPATLLHVDMDKAVRSFGKEHAGQTQLRSLTGQMDTQATPAGTVFRYSGIEARGESFTATGQGVVANRKVEGEFTVDVAAGLVGVPVTVSGPLGRAHFSVPMSAVAGEGAGAVIGTTVLPGIGTAIGAGVGGALGKLFGGNDKKDSRTPPGQLGNR
jgi:hypothetical protein